MNVTVTNGAEYRSHMFCSPSLKQVHQHSSVDCSQHLQMAGPSGMRYTQVLVPNMSLFATLQRTPFMHVLLFGPAVRHCCLCHCRTDCNTSQAVFYSNKWGEVAP
jgi:hypothetical protein